MRRYSASVLKTGLLIISFLAGCEKSPMPTQTSTGSQHSASAPLQQQDQTMMGNIIELDPLFTTDVAALSDDVPSLAKTNTAIVPRSWGRKIESSSRSIAYNSIDDTTVVATVTNNLSGKVWIRIKRIQKDTIIYKPISESIVHKAKFSHIAVPDTQFVRGNTGGKVDTMFLHWRLTGVSGAQGGTDNSGITIQNITFFIADDTLQMTDPLNSFFQIWQGIGRRRIPQIKQDAGKVLKVQVTVKSTDPDSDIVVTHEPPIWLGYGYSRAQMRLVNSDSTGGIYTRVYESNWRGACAGRFNVMVTAITRQSVFDDQAPFSSQVWGIPYIVDQN